MINSLIPEHPTLQDIYDSCRMALRVYDSCFVDLFLATYLSNKLPDDPIWMFFIGSPSSGKSLFMRCVEDRDDFYPIDRVTPNTFISGSPFYPGIAPELNGKVACFNDLGSILGMDPLKKQDIWSQMRGLYDGKISRAFGNKPPITYNDLHVTIIANTTPSIDNERSIFAELGSREIMYRLDDWTDEELDEIADNIDSGNSTDQIKDCLAEVVGRFLDNCSPGNVAPLDGEIKNRLKAYANFITYMRATCRYDRYTGDCINSPTRESWSRLYKSFQKLSKCLLSMDSEYPLPKLLRIMRHIVVSCSQPGRLKMFAILNSTKEGPGIEHNEVSEWSTYELSNIVHLGEKSCYSQLATLSFLGLVVRRRIEENYRREYKWTVTSKGRKLWSTISSDLDESDPSDFFNVMSSK